MKTAQGEPTRPAAAGRRMPGAGVLPAFLFAFVACHAGEFPPELYPQLKDKSPAEIRLAGIAALCPGRLLDHPPGPAPRAVSELRAPRVAELPRGGAYVRLYKVDEAATAAVLDRVGKTALVLDCRYLQTAPADTPAIVALATALAAGEPPALETSGDFPSIAIAGAPGAKAPAAPPPVIVIVNERTTGPIEAALASLQQARKITLVGGKTAGETGVYKKLADAPRDYWAISGEIRPAGGPSLIAIGVAPRFPVRVAAQDEFAAWQLVERGVPLATVFPPNHDGKTGTDKAVGASDKASGGAKSSAEPAIVDAALARAQDVLVALRILAEAH